MKNTVDPWAGRMGAESALLARGGFSGPEHIIDGKEGLFAVFKHVQYEGKPATFDAEELIKDLPTSKDSHYRILDCGMKSFPIEALSHSPLTAMMKTVKEHNIKADDVKEIKVEVIARAADILGDPHKYRPDPLSSQITGAAALATSASGWETRTAIASGLLKAIYLGASSPMMSAV
jgi:2-methylcitrate dehydratase